MKSIYLFLCLPSILAFTQNSGVRNIDVASLSSTKLYGGYDSVVGADPNTPIQLYVSSGSIEELSTLIVLHELDLNYELIDVVEPKPDWFLRVHPEGSTPALRNPVDSDDIIFISRSVKDSPNSHGPWLVSSCSSKIENESSISFLNISSRLWSELSK